MNNSTALSTDDVLRAYVECALWASIDEQPDGNGGPPMDANYGMEDIAPESLASMREDVEAFLTDQSHAGALDYWATELGEEQIGHDLWLTRNGHGAGFWDRFATGFGYQCGQVLTADAKPYGESYLYVGDDGKVYVA
jgi:hypothetical protein